MTAIFRFCIFPFIILGILLIAAEYLLFDTNPNAVKNFNAVQEKYPDDSLAFGTIPTLNANESVLNLTVSDDKINFHKPDHLLQSLDSRDYSGNNNIPEILIKDKNSDAGNFVSKTLLTNRKVGVNDRPVHGIKQKEYFDTNRIHKSHLLLHQDTLVHPNEIQPAISYSPDSIQNKPVMPLSDGIFDNMHYTVKNKVEPSSDFYLYPNAAADKLIIAARNQEKIETIQLFTMTGKSVYKVEMPQKEIDIRNLTNGMYVLIIASKGGSQNSLRILINRD